MLSIEQQAKILTLYFNENKSVRRISLIIGVDRKSVRRVIDRKKILIEKSKTVRVSILDEYRQTIKDLILNDPSIAAATVLHRVRELGYMGGVSTVQNYVRELKAKNNPRLSIS